MQELLETSGDSQAAGSTHKGESLKGSHAGPTSVVGRQGLGRPQLPYWSLPHGRSQLYGSDSFLHSKEASPLNILFLAEREETVILLCLNFWRVLQCSLHYQSS